MWFEARKQERKLRDIMIDHKRRAERRRQFYELVKKDPAHFLGIYGAKCRMYLEHGASTESTENLTLHPWQGDSSVTIDRFDARSHLDFLPSAPPDTESPAEIDDDGYARISNYERYRVLVVNEFTKITETKFLKEIFTEERFGSQSHRVHKLAKQEEAKKKKLAESKASIGFTYSDSSSVTLPASKGDDEASDVEEDSDSDVDLDVNVDINKLSEEDAKDLNLAATNYGMNAGDFIKFLWDDKREAEHLRALKEEQDEKTAMAGRRSRRERRFLKDFRLDRFGKRGVGLSYVTKPDADAKQDEGSSSDSDVSQHNEKIEFITAFGDDTIASEAIPEPRNTLSGDDGQLPVHGPASPPPEIKSRLLAAAAATAPPEKTRSRSRSRSASVQSRKRRLRRSDSREKYRHRRRRRSRSRSRSSDRDHRSHSRSGRAYRRRSRSRSSGRRRCRRRTSGSTRRGRRFQSRSRSRSRSQARRRSPRRGYRRTSTRSSSGSSASSRRRVRQRRYSRSPPPRKASVPRTTGKNANGTAADTSVTQQTTATQVVAVATNSPRRRSKSRSSSANTSSTRSSSAVSLLSVHSSMSESETDRREVENRRRQRKKALQQIKSGVADKKQPVQAPKPLTERERLKLQTQKALKKHYIADKQEERLKQKSKQEEEQERQAELREIGTELRRRERERRHRERDTRELSEASAESKSRRVHSRSASRPRRSRSRSKRSRSRHSPKPKLVDY